MITTLFVIANVKQLRT